MPINPCSSGVVLTALVAILLLPSQYYYFNYWSPSAPAPSPARVAASPPAHPAHPAHPSLAWAERELARLPELDLLLTVTMLALGLLLYVCEWVQIKLLERRLVKLNQYLLASVEQLRARDAQQEQLESTLKMVQNATSEYSLLLYLLLRQHRCLANAGPPSNCLFDKELDEDLNFLRSPTLYA